MGITANTISRVVGTEVKWQRLRGNMWFGSRKSKSKNSHLEYQEWVLKNNFLVFNSSVSSSCLTLCDPVGCSLPGFSVHRILQTRILEWIAVSFSRGSS